MTTFPSAVDRLAEEFWDRFLELSPISATLNGDHRWEGKVGQREIERLRRELTVRDGAAFDLRSFHDEILAHGTLPLATLTRELPNWVVARA